MQRVLAGTALAVSLAISGTAFADGHEMMEGFYVGVSAVAIQVDDAEFDTDSGGGQREAEFDPAFGGEVRVGMDLGDWRAEVAGTVTQVDVDSVSSATDGSGDIDLYTLMVNGYYDVEIDAPVSPYVNVGAGAAAIDGDISYSETSGDTVQTKKFGGVAPAVQVGVGLSYAMTDNVDLTGGYNLMGIMAGVGDDAVDDVVLSHTVKVGFNVGF